MKTRFADKGAPLPQPEVMTGKAIAVLAGERQFVTGTPPGTDASGTSGRRGDTSTASASVWPGKARQVTAQSGNNSTNLPPHWGPDCYLRKAATTGFGNVACEGETKMKYTKEWLAEHPEVRPDPESWRALSVTEYERLQTLPEGYTDCLSRREAVNTIGDGWTIKVIEYLLSGLKDGANDRVQERTDGQLELFGRDDNA